ncbi:MAG: DUF2083 domain-containing protein [Hyphomicrobiales bacterium]|nr:DUF2083 domain-containing protein [Hyphomicrobiales bacterium]
MVRAPIGFRIRSERKALGLTQAELAKRAEISPSYLNLIEANKREIGGALLHKIAALLELDSDALTGRAERRLIADLNEVALEPLLHRLDLAPERAADLVGRHPQWARALLTLYRAWRDQSEIAKALSDRLNQDTVLGQAFHQMLSHVTAIRSSSEILDDVTELDDRDRLQFRQVISAESRRLSEAVPSLAGLLDQSAQIFQAATPVDEVEDFMLQHNAWFPALEQAGDAIRRDVMPFGGVVEGSLAQFVQAKLATTITRLSPDGSQHSCFRNLTRVDPDARQITFLASTPSSTRRFQLARYIAGINAADVIETLLADPLLTSDAARKRARHVLSSYVAGVIIFPYEDFLSSASACRYDIEVLSQRFDASYEQVCHRLITLRNPSLMGIPFAFLSADPAGFLTKRFPLPGLPVLSHGHACPLWAIFNACQSPERTIRTLAEFPDGGRYLMIARAITKPPASYHETPYRHAVMVMCEVRHAEPTVYADGLDLGSRPVAVPVGLSCRMCPRPDCRFRNVEPIIEFNKASLE